MRLWRGQMVVPEARSSHRVPTLNGGALGVVLAVLGLLLYLQEPAGIVAMLLAISPFVLAGGAGYLDDHHGLSGPMKLLLTAFAVLPLLMGLSQGVSVTLLSPTHLPAWLTLLVVFLGLLWTVHLTNFMDGINGLAVLQVLFMLLAAWLFRGYFNLSEVDIRFIVGVAVACVAFLPFNFPHAHSFVGDTGSLFFGVLMAWIVVVMMVNHPNGLWVFLCLFSMFWVDATLTLIRRLLRQKSIFEAHREHAYQHLANEKWQSHTKATLFIMLINVVWLLPMAYAVLQSAFPLLWLLIAIIPVIIYTLYLQAGMACFTKK